MFVFVWEMASTWTEGGVDVWRVTRQACIYVIKRLSAPIPSHPSTKKNQAGQGAGGGGAHAGQHAAAPGERDV